MSDGRQSRPNMLPPNLPPRGLRRVEAAAYIGVSPSLFDNMVAEGLMPGPKRVRGRIIWDRCSLDEAFTCLPEAPEGKPKTFNPWDAMSNV